MRVLKHFAITLFVVIALSCNTKAPYTKIDGYAFASTYHIVFQNDRNIDFRDKIDSLLDEINNTYSTYRENSITSKINRNESDSTNKLFRDGYGICTMVSDKTDGAFDITTASLVAYWGFGSKKGLNQSTPLDSLKQWVGYKKIELRDDKIVKQNPHITLNMSSIGDGLAVDKVAELLEKFEVKNYLIEIGGEIKTGGMNARNEIWRVAIDKPIYDSLALHREFQNTVKLQNKALSTSGSYRKFREVNGKRFAHFIDPKTGEPVTHNLLSATVIHDKCAIADAFSTAFMVMGLERSLEYLKKDTTLSALFIIANGEEYKSIYSNKFEQYAE